MKREARFSATLTRIGSRNYLALPCPPQDMWGERERYSLSGTVGGHPWRGKVEWVDGQPVVSLGPAWLRDNGVSLGDVLEVVLQPEGMQSEDLPPDLLEGLRDDPETCRFFDSLRTFDRKNLMRWLDGAKRPETRAKRVAEILAMLRDRRVSR